MTWAHVNAKRFGNSSKPRRDKRAEEMRNKIRNYLKEVSMTQKEFNARCGCPGVTMSRFMNGSMSTGSFAYTRAQRYFRSINV